MKGATRNIAGTVGEILMLLEERYGSNRGTAQKLAAEAKRLFRYLHSVEIARWEDVTAEVVLSWCWSSRKTKSGEYRRPEQSTARNRQWAASVVLEAAEALGLVADGRRQAGMRIARPCDYVSSRPLTDEEAERVRVFADRGLLYSQRAVIVALALAGGTATEIGEVRKKDIDLDHGMVWIGVRQNPLCGWGRQVIQGFFRIRPDLQEDDLAAARGDLAPVRRAHAISVALGQVISDAGLRDAPGVSARSVRLYRARRILRSLGLECATWFLGLETLTTAADALEYDWRTVGRDAMAGHYGRGEVG